jgi:hypothetical protein
VPSKFDINDALDNCVLVIVALLDRPKMISSILKIQIFANTIDALAHLARKIVNAIELVMGPMVVQQCVVAEVIIR